MCSGGGDEQLRSTGFPIRKSPDRSLVADSPGLIAGSYVLHRLLVPRHPPCALNNLATTDDARVHYAVLKIRAVPASRPSRTPARTLTGFPASVVHDRGRSTRCRSSSKRDQRASVPSGPNSVLDQAVPAAGVPPASRCTNQRWLTFKPNNQCSTH